MIDFFQRRRLAYVRVFDENNVFRQEVLKDLARFCRATQSTFHPDPRVHAMLEGRREVWLRIQEQLNLSLEELYDLHAIKQKQEQ